jgi:quercetin dioxygenase-like cupin family protein
MSLDPIATNPDHYRPVFENEHVRVLEYTDEPGHVSHPHDHPDSVMITLSGFRRRLVSGEAARDVALEQGVAVWLPAQRHHGENIGQTATHVIFVELKHAATGESPGLPALGPD